MNRLFKWLAIGVGVVVVLVVAAVLIIPRVVDPNDYRDTIAEAVESRTGRALSIEGDIDLTVFPWLGVDVGPLEVGQPPAFESASLPAGSPFLRSERTRVRVKLLPLLARRVEMDTVSAGGLVVNLARTADGRNNWDDLLAPAAAAPDEEQPPAAAALALGGLDLREATLRWHDEVAGSRYALSRVTLTTGPVEPAAPIDITVAFDLEAADPALPETPLTGHVDAKATVAFDQAAQTVTAQGLTFAARVQNASGEQAELDAAGDAVVDLERRTVAVKHITLGTRSGGYRGSAGGATLTLTDAAADLMNETYSAARFELTGDLAGEVLDAGKLTFEAAGGAAVDLRQGTVALRGLTVALPAFELTGTTGRLEIAAGGIDGALAEQRFDVQGLRITSSVAGAGPDAAKAEMEIAGDLSLDLARRTASSPDLALSVPAFDVAGHAGSLRLSGALNADPERQRFSVGGLALDGTLSRGPGFTGPLPFLMRGDVDVDLARGQVLAPALHLESSGFDVDAAKGSLAVDLTGAQVDLGQVALTAKALEAKSDLTGKSAFQGTVALSLTGQELRADVRQATLGGFRVRVPAFDIDGNRGSLEASGRLDANLGASRFAAGGLRASGQLAGAALQGGKVRFAGGADASYDTAGESFEISKLALALTEIEYEDLRGAVDLSGNLVGNGGQRTYSGKTLRARGTLEGKAIPGGKTDFDVTGDASVNLAADTLRVANLVAKAAGVQAQGTLDVASLSAQPTYQGTLALAPFNPRPLLDRLGVGPVPTADPKALARVAAQAAVTGGPGRLALRDLVLELDDSTARGNLALTGLEPTAARPRLEFDLVLDGIDADRYMAPAAPAGRAAAGPPPAAAPLALLTNVDVDGQLSIGKLTLNDLRISNFKMTAKGKDRKLEIDPATANLYQGTVNARVSVDTSGPVPALAMENTLRGVQAGPLLTDLQGKAAVTGTADFDLAITTRGETREQLLGGANGTTRFEMHDGTIKGVDIVRRICGQLSQFGVVTSRAAGAEETPFSNLTGSGQIRSGVLHNEDLAVTSPFLRVTGAGRYELVAEQVNYGVTAYLVDSCEGQGRGLVEDLVNIPIPIRIQGPVSDLSYGFDFDRLLQTLARREIEKQGTRILERMLGGQAAPAPAPGTTPAPPEGAPSGSSTEDAIKGILKGILKR